MFEKLIMFKVVPWILKGVSEAWVEVVRRWDLDEAPPGHFIIQMLIWVKMDKQQQSDNTVILTDIGKQKIIVKNKILTETFFNKSLMVLHKICLYFKGFL